VRQKINRQLSIFDLMHTSAIAKELRCISQILDQTPTILDAVHRDLLQGRREDTGRLGLNADQVLRCAILKQYRELTYEELAFYLEDSAAFRAFARLDMGVYPRKSILQDSIKSLTESTWESLHQLILGYAVAAKIETGKKAAWPSPFWVSTRTTTFRTAAQLTFWRRNSSGPCAFSKRSSHGWNCSTALPLSISPLLGRCLPGSYRRRFGRWGVRTAIRPATGPWNCCLPSIASEVERFWQKKSEHQTRHLRKPAKEFSCAGFFAVFWLTASRRAIRAKNWWRAEAPYALRS